MSEILTYGRGEEAGVPIEVGRRLYKYDSKGGLRVWYMEKAGSKHRTIHGLQDGALTESDWTQCVGKQKRSDEEQALFEITSAYKHGLKREYYETPELAAGVKRFFKPQLAEKWSETTWEKWIARLPKIGWAPRTDVPYQDTGAYFQPKLDGFCCIAQASGLTSREGQPIIAVPHIMEALQPLFDADPDAVFHGELYNHALKDDFESLQSILKKQKDISEEQFALARELAQFHIYDYAAPHVRNLGFSQRSEALLETLSEHLPALGRGKETDVTIHYVETVPVADEAQLVALFYAAVEDGYEGGIGRLDGPYVQNRCWWVIKIKIFEDDEFEVVDIQPGVGNYSRHAKRVICRLPDGRTFKAGIKGGKKDRYLIDAFREEGHKVVTIEFFGYTKAGIPRMGRSTKWHGAERTL